VQRRVADRRDCWTEPGDGYDAHQETVHAARLWTGALPDGHASQYRGLATPVGDFRKRVPMRGA